MAQTSIEKEPNTTPAGNFVDDFFEPIPSDQRYNRITYERCDPSVLLSASSDQTQFVLPKRDFPNCYQLNETLICAKVKLTKSDKTTLPDKAKYVGTINNALHSLFKSCQLKLNDQVINYSNVDNYFYKSYFFNLFTFDKEVKLSWLGYPNGWANDTTTKWASPTNTGLIIRTGFFRGDFKNLGDWSNEGALFIGKLYHELFNCDKLIPPYIKVTLTLTRTPDSLYVQIADKTDTEQYAVTVSDLYLLVPTVVLSDPMALELKFKWDKMPIKYNFRTYKTILHAIVKNQQWRTPSLFNTGDNPIRVYLAVVPNSAIVGTYASSPFEFKRKFEYTSTSLYKYDQINSQLDFERAFEQFSKKAALEAQQNMSQNFDRLQNMMQLILQQSNLSAGATSTPAATSTPSTSTNNQRVTRSVAAASATATNPSAGLNASEQPQQQPNMVQQFLTNASNEFFPPNSEPPRPSTPQGSIASERSMRTAMSESTIEDDPIVPVVPVKPVDPVGATKTLELRKLQLHLANQPLGNFKTTKLYNICHN